MKRSLLVSSIVGPILIIINQGDLILSGRITPIVIARALLTVFVPYAVATYAAVSSRRRSADGR